jgi:multiple sugar transport system permease protein
LKGRTVLLFLSPFLLSFAVFSLFPIVASVALSFFDWSPLTPGRAAFVGVEHYGRALSEPRFWGALRNTLVFVAGTIPLTTGLALGLALLVRRPLPPALRTLFRSGFFVPSVVSMVVISLIWKNLYAPYGGLNALLGLVGLPAQRWLLDHNLALAAVMVMDVWASVGYYMILYLAGLEAIPDELYEAASLDGAGFWGRVRHVTWPGLKPMTLFILVINTMRSFQIFTEVFVMTGGGPLRSTETVVLYLYDAAFHKFEMGYASAVAYLLFAILAVFSLLELRWLRSEQRMLQ